MGAEPQWSFVCLFKQAKKALLPDITPDQLVALGVQILSQSPAIQFIKLSLQKMLEVYLDSLMEIILCLVYITWLSFLKNVCIDFNRE